MICVSLRMAASMEAPSALMWLPQRLQARGQDGNGERVDVSTGAEARCGGAHSSEATLLSLSPSHSLVMPSVV